jgi:hypothetical protein
MFEEMVRKNSGKLIINNVNSSIHKQTEFIGAINFKRTTGFDYPIADGTGAFWVVNNLPFFKKQDGDHTKLNASGTCCGLVKTLASSYFMTINKNKHSQVNIPIQEGVLLNHANLLGRLESKFINQVSSFQENDGTMNFKTGCVDFTKATGSMKLDFQLLSADDFSDSNKDFIDQYPESSIFFLFAKPELKIHVEKIRKVNDASILLKQNIPLHVFLLGKVKEGNDVFYFFYDPNHPTAIFPGEQNFNAFLNQYLAYYSKQRQNSGNAPDGFTIEVQYYLESYLELALSNELSCEAKKLLMLCQDLLPSDENEKTHLKEIQAILDKIIFFEKNNDFVLQDLLFSMKEAVTKCNNLKLQGEWQNSKFKNICNAKPSILRTDKFNDLKYFLTANNLWNENKNSTEAPLDEEKEAKRHFEKNH